MVDAGGEVDLRRLEGVVCGEVDGEEEDAAGIWGVALFERRQLWLSRSCSCVTLVKNEGLIARDTQHPPIYRPEGMRQSDNKTAEEIARRKTVVSKQLTGPMIVACQWN